MDFKRIVIERTNDERRWFNVVIDGTHLADGLGLDECLGCIASALYRDGPAQFARPIPTHPTRAALDLYWREKALGE